MTNTENQNKSKTARAIARTHAIAAIVNNSLLRVRDKLPSAKAPAIAANNSCTKRYPEFPGSNACAGSLNAKLRVLERSGNTNRTKNPNANAITAPERSCNTNLMALT